MISAYPLQWPIGRPRTRKPERARFDISQDRVQNMIIRQISLLGGTLPVISTNVELRRDGLPYANRKEPIDKGVAVYFTLRDHPMCFACDRWNTVADNMQAISKTIEALRGIERWGSGDMVQQAFTGFQAIPDLRGDCYSTLGVSSIATMSEIMEAYRAKAKLAHPDTKDGTVEAFDKLSKAKDEALKRLNVA